MLSRMKFHIIDKYDVELVIVFVENPLGPCLPEFWSYCGVPAAAVFCQTCHLSSLPWRIASARPLVSLIT